MTLQELKENLLEQVAKVDHAIEVKGENAEVELLTNTYFIKGDVFLSIASVGFIDLDYLVEEEEGDYNEEY